MSGKSILSGPVMAVLCGVGYIIISIFGGNSINFGGKVIFFLLGFVLIFIGLFNNS